MSFAWFSLDLRLKYYADKHKQSPSESLLALIEIIYLAFNLKAKSQG